MGYRRPRNICRCSWSSLPFSSTILFLSSILPSSSFAQLTSSLSSTNAPPPTTLSSSRVRSSSLSSPSSSNLLSTTTQAPATSRNSTSDHAGDHAFNYYFLIVAVFAVLCCLCILWFGRRKKRKAALMRGQSQRALARDVEGWRTRFRAGLGNSAAHVNERVEGLDERGEAPPPYAPGSKPPSTRSEEGGRSIDVGREGAGERVELSRMSRETNNRPPGYHEAARREHELDIENIARPRPAVTSEFESMKTLLSNLRSSSQA